MKTKVQVKFSKSNPVGAFDVLWRISNGPAWLSTVSVEENLARSTDATLPIEWSDWSKTGSGQDGHGAIVKQAGSWTDCRFGWTFLDLDLQWLPTPASRKILQDQIQSKLEQDVNCGDL